MDYFCDANHVNVGHVHVYYNGQNEFGSIYHKKVCQHDLVLCVLIDVDPRCLAIQSEVCTT